MDYKLRKWQMKDKVDLVRLMSSPRVRQYLSDGIPNPYTESDAESYIASAIDAESEKSISMAIEVEGKAVGSINLTRRGTSTCRTGELGYCMTDELWGKGLMTSAVKEFCVYVFANSDFSTIVAEAYSDNEASQRVLQKAGFTLEGTMPCGLGNEGERRNITAYRLCRTQRN